MFDKNNCYNGGNKHKFEARYSEKPIEGKVHGVVTVPNKLRELLIYSVYEYDICIWCGKTIKNSK